MDQTTLWTSSQMTDDLYRNGARNTKYIPILFDPTHTRHIPPVLEGYETYVIDDSETQYLKLYRRLTDQHETPKPRPGEPVVLEPKAIPDLFDQKPAKPNRNRLVFAQNRHFVGRAQDLEKLADLFEGTGPVAIGRCGFVD